MKHVFVRLLFTVFLIGSLLPHKSLGQNWRNIDGDIKAKNHSMFRPIEDWPDPTAMRNAGGAPGPAYWQQRADYVIKASLDTLEHTITGS